MALRAVLYLRKSSKDTDEKQVNSIPRQRNDVDSYLEKNALVEDDPDRKLVYDLDKDLFQEDASAKVVGRPVFNEMIRAVKKNKYDVLVCTELSRLSRNAVDNGTLVQLLEEGSLKEIRTLDHRFTRTPTDKFTLTLFLSVAKYENDQRALNTASGLRLQRGKGVTTYRAPLGYINCGTKKGEKWVEPDPESFHRCKELWDLFLTDSYSLKELKSHADKIGVTLLAKDDRSRPSLMTIRNMLGSRYYTGMIRDHDAHGLEIWINGNHEAMVSEADFEKAQIILQKRGYRHAKMDKAPSLAEIVKAIMVSGLYTVHRKDLGEVRAPILFSEKVRYTCAHCKHRYYSAEPKNCQRCNTPVNEQTKIEHHARFEHLTQTGAKKNSVKYELVEGWLKAELDKLHVSNSLFTVLKKRLFTLWMKREKRMNQERRNIKAKIEKLELEKAKVYRKGFEDGVVAERTESAIQLIESDLASQEKALKDLREKFEEEFEIAWQKLQVLRDAKEIMTPNIDFEPKKRLILSLISNLVLFNDHLAVEWKSPFDKAVKLTLKKLSEGGGPTACLGENQNGSPDWIRTNGPLINSQLLYH